MVEDHTGLRIVLLGLGRYSGGSPVSLHLAKALAQRHTLRAFLGKEGRNVADWRRAGLDIRVHPVYKNLSGAIASFLWQSRIRRLAREIKAFKPDVLIIPFIHLWVLRLMNLIRVPTVLFVHDPEPHPGLVGAVLHRLERRAVARSAHIIVHSAVFVPRMKEIYGVPPERVTMVPIGPLSDYTRSGPPSPTRSLNEPAAVRILFFGRLEPYKGINVLLDSVPLIRQVLPQAIVHLVGGGGDRALLARAAGTAGVEVDNRWIDEADLPGYFARADLVVLPYTSATQSGVIPIAASFALPVVATSAGGLAEQLCHGACGVIVPPGDAVALANAIIDLASNPARARAKGAALFEEYVNHRSWTAIAEKVSRACRTAIEHEKVCSVGPSVG